MTPRSIATQESLARRPKRVRRTPPPFTLFLSTRHDRRIAGSGDGKVVVFTVLTIAFGDLSSISGKLDAYDENHFDSAR
jgi:hypothetical protein